jgi:hypothetical protein
VENFTYVPDYGNCRVKTQRKAEAYKVFDEKGDNEKLGLWIFVHLNGQIETSISSLSFSKVPSPKLE